MAPWIDPNPHPAVRDCIKELGPNRWLLGPFLICERDISTNTYRTWFDRDGSDLDEDDFYEEKWSPPDPDGPIQFVRCIEDHATWKIGEWAYLKSKPWFPEGGTEARTIKFVQSNAPSVPVPTVLENYVDTMARRSYLLTAIVPGEDLNDVWKSLDKEQKRDVSKQIAEHIHTLAQFKSDRLASAEGKTLYEPYLSGGPGTSGLVPPEKSREWERIWAAGQKEFVFYHADLGPSNIKVKVEKGKIKVTGILDWEIAGYVPKGWIATKLVVGTGLDFDWDGNGGGETKWRENLGHVLKGMGYEESGHRWHRRFLSQKA